MARHRGLVPVGRAGVLDDVRARLDGDSSVVVVGPAGIGKSTVLEACAATTRSRLLRATAEGEPGLPYLTLVDLFDNVTARELAGLPGHLRSAFEGALLRGERPDAANDQLAVRLAVLAVLRRLAAAEPILMVIDDLQWVDAPSAEVLRFVARRVTGNRVRVLREQVYADAVPQQRAAAHEHLAQRLDDPVERARHLALARPYADADLAAQLATAADAARRRGAPAVAAELAERAADRTPPHSAAEAAARRYAAAEHAYAAGLNADTRRLAEAAFAGGGAPTIRVGALLLLVDLAGQDQSDTGAALEAAYAADDDQALLAKVRLYRALKAYYDGDFVETDDELKRAEADAEASGSTDLLVEILAAQAHFRGPLGGDGTSILLHRATELARGLPPGPAVVRARQLYATLALFNGQVDRAVREIESLRTAVQRAGTVRDLAGVLCSAAAVYNRAGKGAQALRAGRECMRLIVDMEATPGPGLLVGAAVELIAGSPDRAAEIADEAIEACRAAGRAALAEAIDRYAAVGASPWLALARAELSRLDGATTAGLTASEQRIVDLLVAGATNREIAAATFLSVKAVEANLTRLYRRHGVRNRAQLISMLGPAAAGSVSR